MIYDFNTSNEIIDILILSDSTYHFSEVSRDYEILFILSGNVQVTVNDTVRKITTGHIIAINPETKRSYSVGDNTLAALFRISRIKLWKLSIGHSIRIECDSQINTSKSFDIIRFLLKKAISCQLQDDISNKLRKYSCYYDILQEIIDKHSNWNAITNTENQSEHETRMLTIIEYIHNNFFKQISLQDLAKHFSLSPSYLSKFVKSSLGIGFLELLNDTRLQYALDDLLKTDMPISKISFENGFPNFASFNRVFKEKYHVTPTEYRKVNASSISKEVITQNQKSRKKLRSYFNESESFTVPSDYLVYSVDAGNAKSYTKYWNEVYSLGHAYDLLNSDVQNHILLLKKEFNFKYLHIAGVFSKELLIDLHSTSGFNFSRLNRIFDFFIENGIIPFIDIGFQPWGMIGQSSIEILYEEVNLDNFSTNQYERLITDFIKQCIQRYGEDELSKWRFDIFRNASHAITDHPHHHQSYLAFFKTACSCIKKLIPEAKISGCGAYTYDTLEFSDWVAACSSEKVMPDFFTVQIYPYDVTKYHANIKGKPNLRETERHFEISTDSDYIYRKIQQLRDILVRYDFSPDQLIVIGWNMSLSCRNFLNDSSYRGAYIVKTLISCLGDVNIMSHIGITDLLYEHYAPTFQLFGGFGLLSKDGIPKPAYYAFEFMNRLGDFLISKGPNYVITKDARDKVYIVCHNCGTLSSSYYGNYHDDVDYPDVASLTKQEPINITMQISGLQHQQYLIKKYIVGEENGAVLNEWIQLGYVENIGRDEIDYLKSISVPRQWSEIIKQQKDCISVSTHVSTNEIQLIQLLPISE